MTAKRLYKAVTNCSNVISIVVSDSHAAPTAQATVVTESTTLDIGDFVTINLGYVGDNNKVFEGYVKNIVHQEAPNQYEITCSNVLIRAVDFFIASSNPEEPYSRENIIAEDLIEELLAMAGLTDYTAEPTSFTFATNGTPLEVNLTSVYDYCHFIANILAYNIYADTNGRVHFVRRFPYPTGGESSVATLDNPKIISIGYSTSDKDLRNRVVVYGAEGIYAEASASSPYLPVGFYKTAAVSAPTVIDSQAMAQDSADYNLLLYNKLTKSTSISIEGNPSIQARDCVTVDKADIGMTGLWYVYGCEHSIGREGYVTNMELRK